MTERKKNPQTKANYYLLDDPDVKRWHDNVGRGSPVTSSIWLRRLGVIHKNFHETPKDLAKMISKEAANFMLDVVSTMEQQERRLHFRSDETDEELVRMERDSDIAKDQDARTDQYRERNIGTAAIVEAFDRVAVKREAKVPLGQSPLFPL